jgi:tetratricopeptide (TPR) repeat protein
MDLARDALQLRPQGHPERLRSLSLLARIVYDHFSYTNRTQTNDLDEVDQLTQEAFQLLYCTEYEEEDELKLLHLRSRAIYNRFSRTDQMEDLEEAIELLRRSLDINTRRHDPLWRLSLALHKRFLKTYMIEDINEAITLQRFALKRCPHDKQPEYGWYLKNFAAGLRARSGITSDQLDVVEAQRIDRMLYELSRSDRYRDDDILSPL